MKHRNTDPLPRQPSLPERVPLATTEPPPPAPVAPAPLSTTDIDLPEGVEPMASAPAGRIVLLIGKDTGGHAVQGIFHKSRRFGGGRNRWQPISYWADPVTRRSLGFDPIGWKEWTL